MPAIDIVMKTNNEKAGRQKGNERQQANWLTSVRQLPGVGERRAQQLKRLNIETWFDLLCWFPRDYEDWSTTVSLAELEDGREAAFLAVVKNKPSVTRRGRLSMVRVSLYQDKRSIQAVWFNQPWIQNQLESGRLYRFYGLVKRSERIFQVQNPSFELADEGFDSEAVQAFKPIYPLTDGLSQKMLRQYILSVWTAIKDQMPEFLPAWIRRSFHLSTAAYAYERIHFPRTSQDIEISRRRIGFEELFLLRCGLYLTRRQTRLQASAWNLSVNTNGKRMITQMIDQLPFKLTQAQQKAWREVQSDLVTDCPMNRLLQGDVGSGKTVIAALAMLQCALAGKQAVLMAPTAILAAQHHQTLSRLLTDSVHEPVLLTGSTSISERRRILSGLQSGEISLVVGTHALIEKKVQFHELGLAITDEQHRFGVRQRKLLAEARNQDKAEKDPHVLVMSATPIPRSLALILYGDLDLSLIDELPPGRQPVETYTAAEADRDRVMRLMERVVNAGHQVYVVCPMIEEQADSDLLSAVAVYNQLSQQKNSTWNVGLIHGRLSQEQKDEQMQRFMSGMTQILVSTTVVEVGVDNPNATMMIIENAERFGLAQLHQLRGRVGRSSNQSWCILMSDVQDELARKRLKVICHASDGFAIAEQDLQLRGPGDFFGTRQHGLPDLRMINLYRDRDVITDVEHALTQLIDKDPDLNSPEHQLLRQVIADRYPAVFSQIGL